MLVHFKLSDFDSPDRPGSGIHMRFSTLEMVEKARVYYDKTLFPKSGYRTPKHNKVVGGVKDSSHVGGWAVDFGNITNAELIIFLEALWKAGFRRFGIMLTSIHVDNDPTKVPVAMWAYDNDGTARWKLAHDWFVKKTGYLKR